MTDTVRETSPPYGLPRPRVRRLDQLTIALFVAALLAPSVDMLVRTDADRSPVVENRQPTPAPASPREVAAWLQYPTDYDAHWNDTFGLRDVLLRWHSIVKVFGFGEAPTDRHVIGEDRWIFNTLNELIESWRGTAPFDAHRLAAWQRRLEERRDAVEALGAHYVFAIAPDKPHVYPDHLPGWLDKVGPGRMDQLFDWLRARSAVDFVDLRPALVAAREQDRPGDHQYFELGPHWTWRGGHTGFCAFVEHLRPRLPALRAKPISAYRIAPQGIGDSEAVRMYIADLLTQTGHVLQPIEPPRFEVVRSVAVPLQRYTEVDDPSLPRVVMFHDSFGPYFNDLWAETCSRFVSSWSYDFDLDLIAREQPDLVVEFVVERALSFIDPEDRTQSPALLRRQHFEQAERTIATLDPTRPDLTLSGVYAGKLAAADDAQGPYVQLIHPGLLDAFFVRDLPPLRGETLSMRVEIEATTPGTVQLFWKTQKDPAWSMYRKVETAIGAGTSVVHLELALPDVPLDGLALRPATGSGTSKLRALELRVLAEDR